MSLQHIKIEFQYAQNNEILPVLLYQMQNLLHLELTVHEFVFDHELLDKPSKVPITLTMRAFHLDPEGPHYLPNNFIRLATIANLKELIIWGFHLNADAYQLMRQISGLKAITLKDCKFQTFENVRNIISIEFKDMELDATPFIIMANPQLVRIKFSALKKNIFNFYTYLIKYQHIKHFEFFDMNTDEATEFFDIVLQHIRRVGTHLESLTLDRKMMNICYVD